MAKPVRLQLSRRKGFDLQAHSMAVNGLPAVNCARPGRWGNSWKIGSRMLDPEKSSFRPCVTAADTAQAFRQSVDWDPDEPTYFGCLEIWGGYGPEHRNRKTIVAELCGRNLACWCAPDAPCHADVLLELANAENADG